MNARLFDEARIAIERPALMNRLRVTMAQPVRQPVAQDRANDGGDQERPHLHCSSRDQGRDADNENRTRHD